MSAKNSPSSNQYSEFLWEMNVGVRDILYDFAMAAIDGQNDPSREFRLMKYENGDVYWGQFDSNQ